MDLSVLDVFWGRRRRQLWTSRPTGALFMKKHFYLIVLNFYEVCSYESLNWQSCCKSLASDTFNLCSEANMTIKTLKCKTALSKLAAVIMIYKKYTKNTVNSLKYLPRIKFSKNCWRDMKLLFFTNTAVCFISSSCDLFRRGWRTLTTLLLFNNCCCL